MINGDNSHFIGHMIKNVQNVCVSDNALQIRVSLLLVHSVCSLHRNLEEVRTQEKFFDINYTFLQFTFGDSWQNKKC